MAMENSYRKGDGMKEITGIAMMIIRRGGIETPEETEELMRDTNKYTKKLLQEAKEFLWEKLKLEVDIEDLKLEDPGDPDVFCYISVEKL